ncbi:MAG: ABC transporter permease [Turicibacter sp.]
MQLLHWLYMNMKLIIKTFPVTVGYMVGIPLVIGLLMGTVMDELFDNPNVVTALPVLVTDEDQSEMSSQLIDFLADDSMSDYLYISLPESAKIELVIPNGYEQALLQGNPTELVIKELEEQMEASVAYKLDVLESLLHQYTEQVQTSVATQGNLDILEAIYGTSAIQSVYIDTPIQLNSVSFYSISMIGFFVFMMVMTIAQSSYKQSEMGLNKRFYSAPLSRIKMFNYDYLANLIYVVFIFAIYVFVYRILGYSFTGPIHLLGLGILVIGFFCVSLGSVISTFFTPKYGNAIAMGLFFLQVAVGGSFYPIESEFLQYLSPSYPVTELFENLMLFNTFESISQPLFIMIGISLVLYLLCLLKEKFRWWEA